MQSRLTVLVVACALAIVGCAGDEGGASELNDSARANGGKGKPVADAAVVELPPVAADASVELPVVDGAAGAAQLADTSLSPVVDADAGSPVLPIADASTPVSESPRCEAKWYRDADGDGFGDPATTLVSCSKPDGYVADTSDCYDGNALAKPGQGEQYAEHRGDGSFDYDCDGVEKPWNTAEVTCPTINDADRDCYPTNTKPMVGDPPQGHCYLDLIKAWALVPDEGWYGGVPGCGGRGQWGWQFTWSRETSYVCLMRDTSKYYSLQSCN